MIWNKLSYNFLLSSKFISSYHKILSCSKMFHDCMTDPSKHGEGSRYKRSMISVKDIPNNLNRDCIFSVASYNVLSQNLLDRHPEHYHGIKPDYLTWSFRSDQIIKEITHFMPDIVCLQEVHHDHYRKYFKEKLEDHGFHGRYKQRTGADNDDGCATFFNRHRFWLQETKTVDYKSYDVECDGRYNVALILVLTLKATGRNVCVANTHLLYNPKRGDIKLTQTAILLAEVDALKRKYSCLGENKRVKKNQTPYGRDERQSQMKQTPQKSQQNIEQSLPPQCAVLVCGDFNLVPYSTLHTFLTHGSIQTVYLMCSQLSGNHKPFQQITNRPLNSSKYLPRQINSKCQFIPIQSQNQISLSSKSNAKTNRQTNSKENQQNCLSETYNNNLSSNISYPNLNHDLNLASSHPHIIQVKSDRGYYHDMQVTQKHPAEVPTTVDYIFYGVDEKRMSMKDDMPTSEVSREGALVLLKYLELPVVSSNLQAIPNHVNGSDHLLIMAQFLLR